jgi:hypothetical protein
MEELLSRLGKLYNNLEAKMTKERYFEMMEQLGQEPIEEEIPPSWEDFPEEVLDAISIFNVLGDRVYPDIGYVGKDYSTLKYLAEVFEVDNQELLVQVLNFLDSRAIKKSSDELKKERDKLKRKTSGPKRS